MLLALYLAAAAAGQTILRLLRALLPEACWHSVLALLLRWHQLVLRDAASVGLEVLVESHQRANRRGPL